MRRHSKVFVDTGAWIALALTRDPQHERALETWNDLRRYGTALVSSIPVALETFTFLDRNANRTTALAWKDSIARLPRLRLLACSGGDLSEAWSYFERREFHKLSAVDATSFVLMARTRIQTAFAFDHHFAQAGFRMA
jgi:predicted nucleic acid-binding protein